MESTMKFYEYKHRPAVETAGLTPRHPCIEIPTTMLTEATEMDVNDRRHRFGMTDTEVEGACLHFTVSSVLQEHEAKRSSS
jgi:hypothetical protein